jgi:hypothetical protein
MTSSVMPSAKYSFSGSALRLRNGSTATERGFAGAAAAPRIASVKPVAVAKRSAGVRARARRTAASRASETVSRTARSDGIGSVNRRASIACAVTPVNGGSPASIS